MHLLLVVRLGTLGLNVLLDAVDGRLVGDQTFLDLVQAVVDVVLQDPVPHSVVLHGVVGRLLGNVAAIRANLLLD